ncbi:hypothetical protein LCGC14_2547880 [marine sediment metagenome]|uniref:VRR-NUC domain-containing protein n=1 Tax=marine sediment metagenome TaxID=412755 RepID=A0A0F9D060_9ZZZZ
MIKETRPVNSSEAELYDLMVKGGWRVSKRGWPDFLCVKDDRIVAIEVKSKRGHRLKGEQRHMMTLLAKLGAECYKWTPAGFEPFNQIPDLSDIHYTRLNRRDKNAYQRRDKNKVKMTQRTIEHNLGLDKGDSILYND